MLKNRTLLWILLFTVLITFCYGVIHLLVLRFKTGDVFAPYSSLRSDPLGTRALYDSLVRLGTLSVQRNYEALSRFGSGQDTTVFYLGVKARKWEYVWEDLLEPLEKIATQGGRLVVSFLPEVNPPDKTDASTSQSPDPEKLTPGQSNPPSNIEKNNAKQHKSEASDVAKSKSGRPKKSGEIPSRKKSEKKCECAYLQERWGVSFGYQKQFSPELKIKANGVGQSESDVQFPPVSWHTALYFKGLDPSWKTIYTLYDQPVIIEKAMGQGSIVFTADSFFVSNEALLLDRNPELLTWLIGPNSRIVFDEHHLGVTKTRGVAALIRTYRLQWFFVSIALLAVLVVWKNATHFVPPHRFEAHLNQVPLQSRHDDH